MFRRQLRRSPAHRFALLQRNDQPGRDLKSVLFQRQSLALTHRDKRKLKSIELHRLYACTCTREWYLSRLPEPQSTCHRAFSERDPLVPGLRLRNAVLVQSAMPGFRPPMEFTLTSAIRD